LAQILCVQSLDIKGNDNNAVESYFTFWHFWPWSRGAFPVGGLSLCLRILTLNPVPITSDNSGQERFIVEGELTKFSADV